MAVADDGVERIMLIEIWSDVVCPWCSIGKRHLDTALAGFEHRDEVEVVWRSFELDPSAPAERTGSYVERLAAKYGTGVDEAQAMIDRMTQAAADVGLSFRFDLARPGNTFDAHRLLHLAGSQGVQHRLKSRLLEATFAEGQPIGDHATLVRLAAEAGLDAGQAGSVLDSDAYVDDVRADEERAADLGISGVPFFVFDGTSSLSGAQPPALLARVLDRVWAERDAAPAATATNAPSDS